MICMVVNCYTDSDYNTCWNKKLLYLQRSSCDNDRRLHA